jgi:RNA-directed DNA polymerase
MRQRMLKKLKEVNLELRRRMHQPVDEQGRYIRALIRGHVRYYGVPFNSRAIRAFRAMVIRLWKKWLSRRSQKGYLNWDRMTCYIDRWVPPAVICHPYPSARFGG